MIRECFDAYIDLCRDNPMGATFITACVVFVVGAWVHECLLKKWRRF